ncbi:MAG: hypothetical protein CL779_03470 [Chloroflexi bacterium]|nr:hypothetical protein [Chloroflexota bacterium]|tara:strand:- start:1230 stop:1493 length:264 start_codon:yes stop_codon:yes gene_type:complete
MNEYERQFIASSETFSDFSVYINLYNIDSLQDIINLFIKELRNTLEENNLTNLCKILDKKNFHIHGKTIEDILTSKKGDLFYICDHI